MPAGFQVATRRIRYALRLVCRTRCSELERADTISQYAGKARCFRLIVEPAGNEGHGTSL